MRGHVFRIVSATTALVLASGAMAWAQLFGPSAEDKAIIQKRAAGLGPAHMRMCAEAIAKRYPIFPTKIVSWSPHFAVGDYQRVGGWKRENASTHRRYEDSLVIMGPVVDSGQFDRWYGAPRCYFGREGGSMRLLTVCATSTQAGSCRVPNPLNRAS
jgi:hypothetical protein